MNKTINLVVILFALFCAAVLFARSDLTRPIDNRILDLRMTLAPRAPSGKVVYVAIDNKSLTEIGVWPWPRRTHADLLDRLTAAGPQDVLFDIDFAFPSPPADDQAFEDALIRAGNATILPVFTQAETAEGTALATNRPLARFADHSWPGLVLVQPDSDGLLRHYLYGGVVEDQALPSVASIMAGQFGSMQARFPVNYAISPDSIPTYSYIDVLNGDVPQEALADRIIIIGAFATELRDNFAVPVHGVISGALVHALATETLLLDVVPTWLSPFVALPLLVALTVLLFLQSRRTRLWQLLFAGIGALVAIEAAAYLLFRQYSLIVPTGMLYPAMVIFAGWRLAQLLGFHSWMVTVKQAQLDRTVDILRQVFEDSSDAIMIVDRKGRMLHHSRMAASLFGTGIDNKPLVPEALEWAAARALAAFEDKTWQPDRTREVRIGTGPATILIEYTVTPSAIRNDDGGGDQERHIATIAARDVTENRRQAARIDYLSNHDERTGALRRQAFLRELSRKARKGTPVAIFALNLHRFKTINVTLGRDVGDQVLRQVVVRLQKHPAGFDDVLRLDGDSFAVCLTGIESEDEARRVAGEIVRSVAAPFDLHNARAQVGIRVGFVCDTISRHATGPMLLDRAEEALDNARTLIGNRIAAHDADMTRVRVRARAIEQAMAGAIARNEFHMLYQPQVSMTGGQLTGVEALVRWTNPDLGPIGPDEFIPIAESNGYVQELGAWVLRQGMRDGLHLPAGVSMAINVSAIQMSSNRVVSDIKRALEDTGFPAEQLWLELTESSLLTPNSTMLQAMDEIEKLGARWALDDFGTGFSSLNYMATLPIRKLKVDRAFVSTLPVDTAALAIIRSVQVMCEGLGITMLCEGVETRAQADVLRTEKCAEGQGFLYGRPQPIADVVARYSQTRKLA